MFMFHKITLENAEVKAKLILNRAKSRIGYIPNIYGMMANSPSMLETYTVGDSAFRQESIFSNSEKEIIYLTISRENKCRYCVAVHSTLADTVSNVPVEITEAIREDKKIPDRKYSSLIKFTQSMVTTHGQPSIDEVKDFRSAGYSERHILDIIHAIAIKTMSNYSNHLFNTPIDDMFKSREWKINNPDLDKQDGP